MSKPQSNVPVEGNCGVFSLSKVVSALSSCSNCQGLLRAHHHQQQKRLWRSLLLDGWTLPIFIILFLHLESFITLGNRWHLAVFSQVHTCGHVPFQMFR